MHALTSPRKMGLEGYRLQAQELSGRSAWACRSMRSGKMWNKIADLRGLGFAAPERMISACPEIAGLAIDNIRRRIADLRELGFADPSR